MIVIVMQLITFLKCKLKPQGMKVKSLIEKLKLLDLFHAKSDKNNIFICMPVPNFQKISALNICDGACI